MIDVVQTGYVIADRLLRPAMVTVSRGGGAPGSSGNSSPGSAVDTKA